MRKILPILLITGLLSVNIAQADNFCTATFTSSSVQQFTAAPFVQYSCQKSSNSCNQFLDEIKLERAIISNALQLTEEQAKFRQKILQDDFSILETNFKKLYDEEMLLKQFQTQNADKSAIKSQQKVIKNLKKEIKKIIDEENKEYKKVLTSEQCAKLREIQKLQRNSFKNSAKQKDYYELNPRMRKFAPNLAE